MFNINSFQILSRILGCSCRETKRVEYFSFTFFYFVVDNRNTNEYNMSYNNSGKPPCKFWQQGNCRNGNRCKFAHVGPAGGGGGFGNNNQTQNRVCVISNTLYFILSDLESKFNKLIFGGSEIMR